MRLPIETKSGTFVAHYSSSGLSRLTFPGEESVPPATEAVPPPIRNWHALTSRAVADVLRGRAPAALPPLDLSAGTDFQRKVWRELQNIAVGKTRAYAEIAGKLGNISASRAVGGACGANPIPLLVPCHRVLAANRKLGGFSGGLKWKRLLLEIEGQQL